MAGGAGGVHGEARLDAVGANDGLQGRAVVVVAGRAHEEDGGGAGGGVQPAEGAAGVEGAAAGEERLAVVTNRKN